MGRHNPYTPVEDFEHWLPRSTKAHATTHELEDWLVYLAGENRTSRLDGYEQGIRDTTAAGIAAWVLICQRSNGLSQLL